MSTPRTVDTLFPVAGRQHEEFDAGQFIFVEGDAGDRLYVVVEGKVRQGQRASDGRECLFDVVGPDEIFGETSAIESVPRTTFACALTDVVAWSITRRKLMVHVVAEPALADFLLELLARRIRHSSMNVTDVIGSDVSVRVARQLLRLAQQFGVEHDGLTWMPLDLTQQQLAHMVGAARESVNKTLGSFAQRGWITSAHDGVVIREPEILSRHAREK